MVGINSAGNQSSLMGQWDSKGWQGQRAVDNAVQGFPKKKKGPSGEKSQTRSCGSE